MVVSANEVHSMLRDILRLGCSNIYETAVLGIHSKHG